MHPPRKLFSLAAKAAQLSPEERRFFARAWFLAPFAAVGLRARGAQRMLERLAERRFRAAGEGVSVEVGERLVRAAFRYGPGRSSAATSGTCLPESIVQYALHLESGPMPRLVIGVRRPRGEGAPSFAAHAWIERADGPRREPDFAPILELSPHGLVGSIASDLR